MFLQELPAPSGLRVPDGYAAFPATDSPMDGRWHCRSAILLPVGSGLVERVIESGYVRPAVLKDYVAELVLDLPGCLLRLVSVHASPSPTEAGDLPQEWTRKA